MSMLAFVSMFVANADLSSLIHLAGDNPKIQFGDDPTTATLTATCSALHS